MIIINKPYHEHAIKLIKCVNVQTELFTSANDSVHTVYINVWPHSRNPSITLGKLSLSHTQYDTSVLCLQKKEKENHSLRNKPEDAQQPYITLLSVSQVTWVKREKLSNSCVTPPQDSRDWTSREYSVMLKSPESRTRFQETNTFRDDVTAQT